jgi:3',5'-nucleoside bisphosphate phosphatase
VTSLGDSERGSKVELGVYKVDLHIHTVLSPCTEIDEMTPKAIVRAAIEQGLHMIAICDHNSARNAGVTARIGASKGLTVLPGMEVTTSEEVHVLGLFETVEAVGMLQEEVYARLYGQNDEETFGYQVVVDEDDMVEDLDERLLIGATTLGIGRVVEMIHGLGGLAVASHVDRSGFGIFSQLGFIPPGLALDAVEVSKHSDADAIRKRYRQCRDYPIVSSSDAHRLDEIGSALTLMRMARPNFEELRLALGGLEGRAILGTG